LFLLLAILVVLGCSKRPNVVGSWNFALPGMPMKVDFKGDGTYKGVTSVGAMGLNGTYHLDGPILVMDPPRMSGPNGEVTPPGGQMRLKMEAAGPDAYRLSAPGLQFSMDRIQK